MGVFGINLGLVDLKRDGNPPKNRKLAYLNMRIYKMVGRDPRNLFLPHFLMIFLCFR